MKGERDKEEEETRRAQYLSANCVIFTYVAGEVTKLVDDHFNKALSQSSDRGEYCQAQIQAKFRTIPIDFLFEILGTEVQPLTLFLHLYLTLIRNYSVKLGLKLVGLYSVLKFFLLLIVDG